MLVVLSYKSGMSLTCQNDGEEQTRLRCIFGELPDFYNYMVSFSQKKGVLILNKMKFYPLKLAGGGPCNAKQHGVGLFS